MNISRYVVLSIAMASLTLGGCNSGGGSGDGSGTGNDRQVRLSGTAAEGAAITGATITAKCSDGSGFSEKVVTDPDGNFEGEVAASSLPCALEVGGNAYHSYARKAGTVNITLYTELVLTIATGRDPADWFRSAPADTESRRRQDSESNVSGGGPEVAPSALSTAVSGLLSTLSRKGYSGVGHKDPFTTEFVVGDAYDQEMDNLLEALETSPNIKSFQDLSLLLSDGNFAAIPASPSSANLADGSLTQCWNPELFRSGSSYQATYNFDSHGGGGLRKASVVRRFEVTNGPEFEGYPSLMERTLDRDFTATNSDRNVLFGDEVRNLVTYFRADEVAKELDTYFSVKFNPITGEFVSETLEAFSRARPFHYDLEKGGSVDFSGTIALGDDQPDRPFWFTQVFKGIDSIFVGGIGEMDTCKVTLFETQWDPGSEEFGVDSRIRWYSAQNGILVKEIIENERIMTLTSASIEGEEVSWGH